jgi:large subunit ribosomal protein L19
MGKILAIEKEILNAVKRDYPAMNAGDLVKVYYKLKEKDKERIHPIEGIVIKIHGAMHRKSFTIRRIAYGQAYEVTFPYYSPQIDKIDLVKESRRKPRRKRLYYLRKRVGKKAMLT